MKFGKLPAQQDARNIKFARLLREKLPEPPAAYDVDSDNAGIWPLPLPLFANDQWGCCVIAARANQTLRFEKLEQGEALDISDADVLEAYWREQGGDATTRPDAGLYILESLKEWRRGWRAGGRDYNIFAFAEIDRSRMVEIKQAVWLLAGLQAGVMFRDADLEQFDRGQIWTLARSPGDFAGGHAMWIIGYTLTGPVFLTWGRRQVATWEWFLARCDELYGVVDDRNRFMVSPLDVAALEKILRQVTA